MKEYAHNYKMSLGEYIEEIHNTCKNIKNISFCLVAQVRWNLETWCRWSQGRRRRRRNSNLLSCIRWRRVISTPIHDIPLIWSNLGLNKRPLWRTEETPTIELRWWRLARTASRHRLSPWSILTRTESLTFGRLTRTRTWRRLWRTDAMLRLLSIFPLTVMMVSDARSRTVSSWWLSASWWSRCTSRCSNWGWPLVRACEYTALNHYKLGRKVPSLTERFHVTVPQTWVRARYGWKSKSLKL